MAGQSLSPLHTNHPMENQGNQTFWTLCTTWLLQNSTEIPCRPAITFPSLVSLPIMQNVSLAVLFYDHFL